MVYIMNHLLIILNIIDLVIMLFQRILEYTEIHIESCCQLLNGFNVLPNVTD